jgi:hypothetical protein
MEFITTFPVTKENHDAVVVIVDKLFKLVIFIPTRTDMDTVETAKKFFNHWYRWFGLPTKIISNRDGRFISRFWKEIFRLTQTRMAMSTSYHPQTDGQTEKAKRTLDEMIRHRIYYQQNNWTTCTSSRTLLQQYRALDHWISPFHDDVWSNSKNQGGHPD